MNLTLSNNVPKALFTLLACSLLCGCLKNNILIKVNPDGSGTILVTRFFSRNLIDYYNSLKPDAPPEEQDKNLTDPSFNEKFLRAEAGSFGTGVKFVNGRKLKKHDAYGSAVLYSFRNINQVRIPLEAVVTDPEVLFEWRSTAETEFTEDQPADAPAVGQPEDIWGEDSEHFFTFEFKKAATNELKVNVPLLPMIEPTDEVDDETWFNIEEEMKQELSDLTNDREDAEETPAETAIYRPFGLTGNETGVAVARKILGQARFALHVEVSGTILKSDASYPRKSNKNRFTLVDLALNDILGTEVNAKKTMIALFENEPQSPLEFYRVIRSMPKALTQTNAVTVTFRR